MLYPDLCSTHALRALTCVKRGVQTAPGMSALFTNYFFLMQTGVFVSTFGVIFYCRLAHITRNGAWPRHAGFAFNKGNKAHQLSLNLKFVRIRGWVRRQNMKRCAMHSGRVQEKVLIHAYR